MKGGKRKRQFEREEQGINDGLARRRKELADAERSYQAELDRLRGIHPDEVAGLQKAYDDQIQQLRAELAATAVTLRAELDEVRKTL